MATILGMQAGDRHLPPGEDVVLFQCLRCRKDGTGYGIWWTFDEAAEQAFRADGYDIDESYRRTQNAYVAANGCPVCLPAPMARIGHGWRDPCGPESIHAPLPLVARGRPWVHTEASGACQGAPLLDDPCCPSMVIPS